MQKGATFNAKSVMQQIDAAQGNLGLVRKQTNRALVWRSLVKVEDSG